MQRVAGFIDAGYFWVQLTNLLTGKKNSRDTVTVDYKKFHQVLLDYVAKEFPEVPLLRIYCYDAPDRNGTKTVFHRGIDELDDFKLRLGTRNLSGTQKAVDGLIIADMIGLAQKKSITHAFIISGDGDLVPGVIATQSQGLRVHLLSIEPRGSTSPHLSAEVDKHVSWGSAEISLFARQNIPSPSTVVISASVASSADVSFVSEKKTTFSLDVGSVVLGFFNRLSEDEKKTIKTKGNLPREIDKKLLRAGYEANLLCALTEFEKRQMRVLLREMVRQG